MGERAAIEELHESFLIENCSRWSGHRCGRETPSRPHECCNTASWEPYRRHARRAELREEAEQAAVEARYLTYGEGPF